MESAVEQDQPTGAQAVVANHREPRGDSLTMRDFTHSIDSLLGELDRHLRGAAKAVRAVFEDEPYEVLVYRGYGNASEVWIQGRVVEQRRVDPSRDSDSSLRNLMNTYRRVDSDPLPHSELLLSCRGMATPCRADDEGFFGGRIEVPAHASEDSEWIPYDAELVSSPRAGTAARAIGEILVPPPSARFGVISDIDDTVIQSRVSNFLEAARTVMLGNARTRLPFPGVAAFYRALREGASRDERNPLFYVSSSPWNLYDVITEFMELQQIPKGPVLLRDWDVTFGALAASRHLEHKGAAIREILATYPRLPFILIGDSGQHDPEIYAQIVREFPERIRAIYIRDVTRTPERSASIQALAAEVLAARSTLVLAEDTVGAARHAADQGWIRAATLDEVHDEKRADAGQTDAKVATPDGGEGGTGRTPAVIE
jgi:phosphatidate phosphatase APP1